MDISEILNEWPYEPGQINVRVIEGNDGEPRIQMRLDLGILQMEVTGRPDGQRPHNCESVLEYFETLLDDYAAGGSAPSVEEGADDSDDPASSGRGSGQKPRRRRRDAERASESDSAGDSDATTAGEAEAPGAPGDAGEESGGAERSGGADAPGVPGDEDEFEFTLSPDDCRQLREEAVQYYHRYISLLVLGDFQGVLRDTMRNSRVLNLCREYAEEEDDQEILEQFRPYLAMMRTRAVASQAIADGETKAAVWAIDEGLEALRKLYDEAGRGAEFDGANEVLLLRGMKDELMKKLPASQRSELLKRLQEAIERENYELAAILRDELKMLKE